MFSFDGKKIIAICGQAGAGKDTFYELLLKPRGYIRWQMALHYKVYLVSTGRFTYEEVFYTKPPGCRQVLQEEITEERYEWHEKIWIDCFKVWMRSMEEIIGVNVDRIAITDTRFLIEIKTAKEIGAKIIHITSKDQQSRLVGSQKNHRSEVELLSPEMKILRDVHIINRKDKGTDWLKSHGFKILKDWGYL